MKFHRQDSHKKAKLDSRWRKPRGLQSKMRLKKRGYALTISVGYGNDNKKKHLVKGLVPVVVATIAQLEKLDDKTQGAIFVATLGDKKKELLLNKAKELKITVLNFNVEKALSSIASAKEKRKQNKKDRLAKKTIEDKAKTAKKDTAKDAKPAEKKEEVSAEEKKEQMNAQKEKVLTQRQ